MLPSTNQQQGVRVVLCSTLQYRISTAGRVLILYYYVLPSTPVLFACCTLLRSRQAGSMVLLSEVKYFSFFSFLISDGKPCQSIIFHTTIQKTHKNKLKECGRQRKSQEGALAHSYANFSLFSFFSILAIYWSFQFCQNLGNKLIRKTV